MSLPIPLVQNLKSIPFNPEILSSDPQLSYILSFISHPISNQSIYFHPRDSYQSPLSQYQFADFDDNTYQHLLQQTTKNYKSKNVSVVKGIRQSFKQFYARVSAMTYQAALKHNQSIVLNSQKSFQTSKIELDYRIQTMKGNIPSKWPEGLNEFQKQLNNLPWNAFSTESEYLLQDFISQIKLNICNSLKKIKNAQQNERVNILEKITHQMEVLVTISLKTLSQSFVMQQILFVQETLSLYELNQGQVQLICHKFTEILKKYIASLPNQQNQSNNVHSLENFWDKNGFLLMKKIHFHKIPGLAFYSVTTDGKYLYVFVSAVNGGMYKFGTGNNGTTAGKLYNQRPIHLPIGTKVEEVNWVYLKGKLYIKTSGKDPFNLDVISPQDFKKIGNIQLACKSLFGHSVLTTLNKNSILLTDGQNLYFLGKRIKITQNTQLIKNKSEQKKQDAQNDKTNKKKKKKKNNQGQQNTQNVQSTDNQQPTRVLQIVLAQFDINGQIQQQKHQIIDEDAIIEIFESFSGYFTKEQCKRAYRLNHYDIMQACQWLFDEGNKQKDRNIRILPSQKVNVIYQAEIASNFNQKTFKSPSQIVTKDGSLLHMYNINQSIWTVDRDEITCYSESGVKIFKKNIEKNLGSKDKNSSHFISKKQGKFPRNPQYSIIHDPYNKLFYTFCWNNDGRYFPCPVLVSKDKKQELSLQIQRRSSVDTSKPLKINQISRYYITQLSLLQYIDKRNFKFNDHVWWYGQKIKQINSDSSNNYEQKKKLSNKKTKLITKINKLNELTKTYQHDLQQFNEKGKVKKQIIKIYPFSSDGTLNNLNQILSCFKNIQDSSKNGLIAAFLIVIQKWLRNCSFLSTKALQEKLSQLLSSLLKIRNGPLTSDQNKHQINKLIIKNFYIFYQNKEDAIRFLVELSSHQIQSFLKAFDGNSFIIEKQFIIYQLNKKDQIISKFDSKNNFGQIFKQKSSISVLQKNNVVSNLLLRKQSSSSILHTGLLNFLQNSIINLDSSLIIKFFKTLFLCSFKQINTMKQSSQKVQYLKNLFEDTFKIFERCLSNISFSKTIEIVQMISYIVQIYYSSIIRISADQNIIKSLLKIIQLLQKPQLAEFFNYIQNTEYQGISAIQQRIYETCHPLERGKSQSFPSAYFPQSSLLFLQFDRRCQSDQNHDIMTIQLLHEQSPVGNSIPCHDGVFTTNLRLTGKVQMKRPTLMLGNNISVDFTSSGHAKDAQSFGRFGFKFGLRPIIAGKILFEKNIENNKIQKVFNNKNNFKSYINVLKFLVVATSASIQNLFTLEKDECSQNIKNLLKGKIMRQGLQEVKKNQTQYSANLEEIINNFLNKQHIDTQKNILKNLNLSFKSNSTSKKQEKSQKQVKKDIWNSEGIPQYIKSYIEQIKIFKGDFVEVFKQARQHAPPQGSYFAELKRQGFTQQMKDLWLQGQALLFLTVLKHSGLLHLNLKFSIEYIKQNLKAFQQARNGIFYAFITRMQTVRQWRDLVQTYHCQKQVIEEEIKQQKEAIQQKQQQTNKKGAISIKKNNNRTVKVQFQNKNSVNNTTLNKKVVKNDDKTKQDKIKNKQQQQIQNKKQIEKQIRQRLNQQFLVQKICQLKGIAYVQNNIFENATRIIEQIKKVNPQSEQIKRSVYFEPIQHLISGCLFLLNCKSPSTRQSLQQDNDIVPMALGRSLSYDNRNADKNKVELFRQWLQNWKKWKGFKKENKVQLKFPVLQIVEFINSWTNLSALKQSINKRSKICEYRVEFYKYLNQLLKLTNQSICLNKYVFGSQISSLGDNFKSNLESAPLNKLDQLTQTYNQYIKTIKQIQSKFIRQQLPISYSNFLKSIKPSNKNSNNYKLFLEKLRVNSQILYMIQSQNPAMSLDIALYFINFKFLSNQNQEILFLASLITQRAFLVDHKLDDILSHLKKQVGNNNLCAKRWKDLLFVQRILFLLRKLETIIHKRNLQIDQKQKIAQTLFYMINLIEVPLLCRISIKILKKLKDVNFANIPTIFNYRYKTLKLNQQNKTVEDQIFSIQNTDNLNNIQLLAQKSLSIFKANKQAKNQIQKKLMYNSQMDKKLAKIQNQPANQIKQVSNQKIEIGDKQNYNIILSLHHQEDLIWFLRVLYYIQELQRQSGKGSIPQFKDWKDYIQSKNNKQNKKNQQQQQQQANNANQQNPNNPQNNKNQKVNTTLKDQILKERILASVPQKIKEIDPKIQQQMPIAWYMNYCNIFNELSIHKHIVKNSKQTSNKSSKSGSKVSYSNNLNQNNPNKKAWPSTQFLKVTKKFQEFNGKPIQEPKQTDSQQIKQQFIKAKNFIGRIRRHLAEISSLINQFTNFGYVVFREDINKQKAIQLCHLISLGAQNRLLPIKTQFTKDEYKNRIVLEDSIPNMSKIKVTLIQNDNYQVFEQLLSLQSAVGIQSDNILQSYMQINKRQYILQDSSFLPYEDFFKVQQSSEKTDLQFSREFIDSQIFKMKKRHEQVYLPDYPKLKYFISQGGIQTGLKNVSLVPASQPSLTIQSIPIEDVLTSLNKKNDSNENEQQMTDFPQQIIPKVIELLKLNVGNNSRNQDEKIKDYLLVSFYLKKLSKMDLKFVQKQLLKTLATFLVQFSDGFKSYQPIQHYQSEIQKLIIKYIDNQQPNLKIFEIFNSNDYQVSPNIAGYVSKSGKSQKKNQIKTDLKEDFTTYHYPKSKYLIKSQPPQIEQNKLLKYWEKNILPKIFQFVKTTLKPIEIEDFFEQMRIPLRKNDQMQAKKIAYVICDNKLPQGAVLPDSNHNWNSLTLQDISIGQYALLKLPKQTLQSISPLLVAGNQQYRLVKVVFIDIKSPSILVRYRIDQYSLMGYLWVPITSLVRVQKQIMHLSPKDLSNEIQKNLQGMIYGYSKLCLTQLTSVSSLDQTKLIKQTITDMFINNPISGWLQETNNQWSMRHALKKMLKNNQLQIINYLQKEFCPISSVQLDLFSDQTIKLNRFQNATSLIVSFKKSAILSLSSGIKFYKDPYLFNQIMHIYTAKTERDEFQPVIFNDPNVYCKYYTNKECLKISQQNKYNPKPILVTVFGVNQIWTIGCYLGDVISQICEQEKTQNHLQILKRLNKLYVKWILEKKVAVLCSQLCKLVTKITNRMIKIQEHLNQKTTIQSLGLQDNLIKELIIWTKTLLEQQQKTPLTLYSELIQNLSETVAVILKKIVPITKVQNVPQHIQAMISLINVIQRIDEHIKGNKITQKPQPNGQWQRFLLIQKIPAFVQRKQLVTKIKQLIKQNKGKILTPKYDIYFEDDKLIICVQGWNITQLVQEEIVEKIQKEQQEQQKQQQQQQGLIMQWPCEMCTFINPMGNSHCEVCGNQMPPPPVAKQIYEEVQATDVSKAENKLKDLQAKRFQTIKQQIIKFFDTYWENYCKTAQKFNKDLENQMKNRVINRKKQQKKQQEKRRQIPQKPKVQLKTGSQILNQSIIEKFLEKRFQAFKDNVKKLVQSQSNFISKFKKLQTLGYDLWCDNIFHENPSLIPFQRLYQLMNYIQGEICKGSSSVLSYSQNSIRLLSTIPLLENNDEEQPINYQAQNNIGVKTKYKNLAEIPSYNIRYSWRIVKQLNIAASKSLQFINMNLQNCHLQRQKQQIKESDSLGYKIRFFRNLIMGAIKLQLNQKIIQKTSVLREPQQVPKVYLERLKVRDQKDKDHKLVTIKQKDDYLFTKSHEQFSKVSLAMLRPFKPKGTDPYLSFSITFRGQMAMGQAGPYRQFFTDISNQLDPKSSLGLFIPTPNNKHNTGQSRSKWIINPQANSSYHLSLFQFLGVLMGCCLRTGTHLALDLPKIFWKLLVNEKVNDSDLEQIDQNLLETLKMIKDIPNQEMFQQLEEYSQPITWVYRSTDQQEHEMIYNGKNIKVTFEERQKYISEVKRKRVYQSILQVNKIKKGLREMMPQSYFNCITGDQLKLMVCGRPKVDVDLLKKHTKYAGGLNEEERRIKYFWQVMKQIDEPQKLRVIKFCWGQQRLPINSEQFERNNIRFMIKPMMNQKNNDQSLPKADTCFFNIQLPNYSTKQILRQRLLLAINMDSVSINADQNFNPDDNPLMDQIEDDGAYDEGEQEAEW